MATSGTAPTASARPASLFALLLALTLSPAALAQSVFINEIHYDNVGGDVGEFVEIAGPAGTDLEGWSIVFYNGANGNTDSPAVNISGVTIDDEGDGFGAVSFARTGIQNGAPDGLALVNADGDVVQFLSYEGSFTANNGPAAGLTSEDIGVDEQPAPPAGQSLQLKGAGTTYDDFAWTAPTPESPGDINDGQTFVGAPMAGGPIVVTTANDENDQGEPNGLCSLREAVIAANTNTMVDACLAGTVDGDTITFAAPFDITLTLGEILITDDVEIDGTVDGIDGSGRVSVDGNEASRIFDVDAASGPGDEQAVGFTALILQNGDSRSSSSAPDAGGAVDLKMGSEATFTDTDVTGSIAGINGGGIHGAGGTTITITTTDDGASLISGNIAEGDAAGMGGGGVWGAGSTVISGNVTISDNAATGTQGSGGGVFNFNGTLSITDATISNNSANRAGGGVEDFGDEDADTDVTLTDVTLMGNFIDVADPGNGGGLHSGGGEIVVMGGVVTGNTAVEGGGLWTSGTLDLSGTTITNNTGTGDEMGQGGGGLYNESGTMTVTDATIDGNTAPGTSGSGGGILSPGGTLTVTDSEISNGTAPRAGGGIEIGMGTVTLTNVDFDANSTGSNPGNGGALHVTFDASVTATGGTVSGNTAASEGGGFWNSGTGTMTVTETSFSGNTASGNAADNGGGGLFNNGGTLVLNDVTVGENVADGTQGSGGGLFNGPGGTLTVNGGTISDNAANRAGGGIEDAGGTVMLTDVVVSNNSIDVAAPGNGGGLHSGGGNVTVNGGSFENNTATEGGGLWSNATLVIQSSESGPALITGNEGTGDDAANGGGGVYAETGASVTIDSALLFGNSASGTSGSGGGILVVDGASVTMTLGAVDGNSANRAGGGIEVASGGMLSLSQVSVVNNVIETANPGNGGGLHVGGVGQGTVSQSTFSGNSAAEGGGLWNSGFGTLNVNNSTVSGNAATGEGGGVYTVGGGATTLESVTVAENTAGTNGGGLGIGVDDVSSVSLNNTIVGDNTAAGQGNDCFGSYTTNGFLLIEDPSNCEIVGADENTIFGEDPQLGPLMDNGGPTLTHALLLTSPAVDAGQSAFAVDQRDVPRSDDQDDLGAFERGDGGALACSTASPLSFDFDGDGESSPTSGQGNVGDDDFDALGTGDLGEFVGLRNEGGPGGEPAVDLSEGCTFVVFDAIAEEVTYVDGFSDGQTVVAAGDSLVIANMGGDRMLPAMTLPDGPGAFALVTGPAMVGDGPELFAPAEGSDPSRVVAAVVYGRDREVFGSIQGRSTAAELAAFREAMAAAFGGATDAEGGPDGLAVRAWPNPTSGAATVSFGLAEAGDVTVAVYDALGRQVAVVADGAYGPGQHEAAVPSLPAGVYAVRVLSRGEARTARLTVAR